MTPRFVIDTTTALGGLQGLFVTFFRGRWQAACSVIGMPPGAADREDMPVSFNLYLLGFVILLAGLIYGATLINIPTQWIVVGTIVMVGLGLMSAVKGTRQKDPPAT